MTSEETTASTGSRTLQTRHVYLVAAACLVMGLAIGYLIRGSRLPVAAGHTTRIAGSPHHPAGIGSGHMPTLQEMKQMADKQAAPLLERLNSDPNNSALLMQVGAIYHTAHQFKDAATYYSRAVQTDSKNVALRSKLAASLYRSGDVDGALAQLDRALTYDSKDPYALFNLGMIKWQAKGDNAGALAAWQKLLKSNPQLSADRKATVQQLMAEAQAAHAGQHRIKGVRTNDGNN